ncbi:hypothetical protein [Vibrio scophthalmi]|uniref:Uncharacterized protein n=1 Tax=Vibrio scophthalmi LMG 19158 TaxID=870967 RepID=F9RIH6_9VIBR|nr:hypothetical protein [Vibrio scophthalmi]EGU42316.1 hypothetical protein VIS19158_19095 [Vibrio scophthalmi LMG 19158]
MITGFEYIQNNSELISKEVNAIIVSIEDNIESTGGYFSTTWTLDFAPKGLVDTVAIHVKKQLHELDWQFNFQTEPARSAIKFEVLPIQSTL